jgi:hypothetical protein
MQTLTINGYSRYEIDCNINQIETTRQTALKWWNSINGTFEQKKLGDDY